MWVGVGVARDCCRSGQHAVCNDGRSSQVEFGEQGAVKQGTVLAGRGLGVVKGCQGAVQKLPGLIKQWGMQLGVYWVRCVAECNQTSAVRIASRRA